MSLLPNQRRQAGLEGESIACQYLVSKRWQILKRNFYSKYGEIDIIARDPQGVVVFCEVKTYKPQSLVSPLEAITPQKIKKIRKTALFYLSQTHSDAPARVDVLVVLNKCVHQHLYNIET